MKTSPYAALLNDDTTLFEDALAQRQTMNKIVADIAPRRCFSGHFHRAVKENKFGIDYQGLDIEEMIEFVAD